MLTSLNWMPITGERNNAGEKGGEHHIEFARAGYPTVPGQSRHGLLTNSRMI
jgi:hypothetical protein